MIPSTAIGPALFESSAQTGTKMQNPPQDKITALETLQKDSQFSAVAQQAEELASEFPQSAPVWNILGKAQTSLGDLDAAVQSLKKAIELDPDFALAFSNLGDACSMAGRLNDAVACYQKAIALAPESPDTLVNLGIAFMAQGRFTEAVPCFRRSTILKRGFVEAHYNMGLALQELGKTREAIAAHKRALRFQPDLARAEVRMLRLHRLICDWQDFPAQAARYPALGLGESVVSPFAMLAMDDSPERQLHRARKYTEDKFVAAPRPHNAPTGRSKLRIGYFSSDFHDHAVLYLIAGLFRVHDKSAFELYGYSSGPITHGQLRETTKRHFDVFTEASGLSNQDLVALARSHELDIAIDLSGYTQRSRTQIFASGLAPVQINYLGYPGTMGADFMDYIVADPTVLPAAERGHISESVIYLPHCYQPNDNQRPIAETNTTRKDFGLPQDGIVFCCFNNSYKISPAEFGIWMRLLGKVENSVLWLLRPNAETENNLRRSAAAHGISPYRLVFAKNLPQSEHLARHKHADIFVDTFNYNAHTTASDALWSGLPVVTKVGRQFAARVAASILNAAGLPELVTETDADYEALIFDLATDRPKLEAIKAKLAANRRTAPLFDTEGYARAFERGLSRAHDLAVEGKPPQDIWITED